MLNQFTCETLSGVGKKTLASLNKLNIFTLQDLLFHLPYRYENRSQITPIADVLPGSRVLVKGCLTSVLWPTRPYRKGATCQLDDGSGSITVRFFHTYPQHRQLLKPGLELLCFGEVRAFAKKPWQFELIHPEYQPIKNQQSIQLPSHLLGIYSTTEGMSQALWRKLIYQILNGLADKKQNTWYFNDELAEIMPNRFPNLVSALRYLHQPPLNAPLNQLKAYRHITQQRLIIEELLAHTLQAQIIQCQQTRASAPALPFHANFHDTFLKSLPFSLTQAQTRVAQEIQFDLSQATPMQRLLQGDVGSGKTIVAALASLQTIANQYQVAVMTPTELLSDQHTQNFQQWFNNLGFRVVCLRSKLKTTEKRHRLEVIKNGHAQIIIGTQALFQEKVIFHQLGLIIIDEQHRFGVQQRLQLWKKGQKNTLEPHQLFMTATPIPRTLSMSRFTSLNISMIDELPPQRLPITTVVVSAKQREKIVARVNENCRQKKQVYWVCPLINESEKLHYQAATQLYAELKILLPRLRLELLHGRLNPNEKERIMQAFKAGAIDMIVATTVIEVGVDVPNANLMIIENAERLGLAQLHQLRGRVGRGSNESFCVLLYDKLTPMAKQRLHVIRKSHDGLFIAEKDLELRGPGEMYGLRQTGWAHLRIADLQRDYYLLPQIEEISATVLKKYPERVEPLIKRWLNHLAADLNKI